MIYIATSCLKHKTNREAIDILRQNCFSNIELSGGLESGPELVDELLELKEKHGLSYLCHNSFASPVGEFAINLASLNNKIYENSLGYLKSALRIAKKIGAQKFGIHAGFFIDIPVDRLGKRLTRGALFDKGLSIKRFCQGFKILQSLCNGIEVYIENNVYSLPNFEVFKDDIPFMLICYSDYLELRRRLDFKLLLDIAHLKITSNSLNLGFDAEMRKLAFLTDYMHLSENDGISDQNKGVTQDSHLLESLKKLSLKDKTITLEVYPGIAHIRKSYDSLRRLF